MNKARSSSRTRSRAKRFLSNLADSVGSESHHAEDVVVDSLARALHTSRREDLLDAIENAIDEVSARESGGKSRPSASIDERSGRCDPFYFG